MRSEEQMISLITDFAKKDKRVKAVLLTGSRANLNTKKDRFQDFDIVYVVAEMKTLLSDHTWIDYFGERIALQMPDEMTIGFRNNNYSFAYLMLFKDGNRIDLTLIPVDKIGTGFHPESLAVCLLDKDNIFLELPASSERDYLIKQPTEKEFADCCNEFWWVSTYIAKGLFRKEVIYAKHMFEVPVRSMFLKMIEWYIGVETGFSVSLVTISNAWKIFVARSYT